MVMYTVTNQATGAISFSYDLEVVTAATFSASISAASFNVASGVAISIIEVSSTSVVVTASNLFSLSLSTQIQTADVAAVEASFLSVYMASHTSKWRFHIDLSSPSINQSWFNTYIPISHISGISVSADVQVTLVNTVLSYSRYYVGPNFHQTFSSQLSHCISI